MYKLTCLRYVLMPTLFFLAAAANAQQLKVKDFALWGGTANASSFNSNQGVFFSPGAKVTGSVGSTQQVQGKDGLLIQGNVVSGNGIAFTDYNVVKGDLIAEKKAANFKSNAISSGYGSNITGNVVANGKVVIKKGSGLLAGFVTGIAKVPAPTTTNYSGPAPKGGFSTTLDLPTLPLLPSNTPFDNKSGTTNIATTKIISPGSYRTLALTGGKTVTFSGPGNYIFYNVKNSGANEVVFDLKNTADGTINIFIVNDAVWGKLASRMVNGNFPRRVYTEVHGSGSSNGGYAFDVTDGSTQPASSGIYNWLGAVWAPNGGINIRSGNNPNKSFIHVSGALWSGTKVSLATGISIVYQATVVEQNFVAPYYPPPANGKVDASNTKIGAELLSLTQNTGPITTIPDNNIYRLNGGTVLIDVISKEPNDGTLLNELKLAGMTGIINNGPDRYVITGYFPIAKLSTLNNNSKIVYVRPCYPAISNAGQVTTQGDTTMRSHNVRSRFGLDGEGVKVGVFSDSYDAKGGAQHDVDEDDLPGVKSNTQPNANPTPVQVVQDLSGQHGDEGRAMLQIVHDIAPKAKLAFYSGFLTAGNFADGIKALTNPDLAGGRCDVLVDDITYITEPFLRDGLVAKVVDSVVGTGVTYFSSAGNFGNKSYESDFQGVSNPSLFPAPAMVHRFGSTNADIYQTLKLKPGTYTIVLQWGDDFYSLNGTRGVQSDLDLYLLNSTGFTLFGFNRSNLFGDPFEVCPFTVSEETEAKLMIVNATGNSAVHFKYIIFNGDGTIVNNGAGGSTVVGHANAAGAIAVGAMLYANIPQYTPVYPSVASFSSRGGTFTLNSSNQYVQRQKPDLIAPNGVNTTVNLGGPVFNDGDPYPNFFGTSAAAPHAAGAAALFIQAKKKYGLQTTVTSAEVRNALQGTAGKLANQNTVPSLTEGYGYVQADSAVQQIANARPIINSWEPVVSGTQPGSLPFQVRVKGGYLTDNTVVYFNGQPLQTNVSANKTEAVATVPPIAQGDDPPLQLYNAAKSPSGLDGGFSEALHFFSARLAVTVVAQNASRKFGQLNPAFTSRVLVNGVPIEQTKLTLADLKLDGDKLSYSTFATPESNAGLYSITPARSTPLDPNDPLLLSYGFTFVSGTLTVEKMPLKITPLNQIVKYGDFPNEVEFDYAFNSTQPVSPNLLDYVKSVHKRYLAGNALAVMNGYENLGDAEGDLNNTGLLASFQSIKNGRVYALNNGQLKALVNNVPTDQIGNLRYIVDLSAQSFAAAKANSAQSYLVAGLPEQNARGLLGIKSLASGTAKAGFPDGQLQPVVNGQLLAMVNGQLQAVVNGQLQAVVNGQTTNAADIIFQNGQLLALVNGQWQTATSGVINATVNGQNFVVNLSVQNGQLQAVVNGQLLPLADGQLQGVVNGQLLAVVNGQLQAQVNGQLMPVVNGQLLAMVNGQLQPVVNGQLLAIVNGQLLAVVNGELRLVDGLSFINGQLKAVINGQLQPVVNGQLKAMVNGKVEDVANPTLVNGQLQAVVNGQLQAVVNGQLLPIVNGQLKPLVNGDFISVSNAKQLSNGQLQAVVNGTTIPIRNGQLQAVVNGQLLSMVNGQLMAVVNGELTFAVFQNGQLQAAVNGQLQPVVNGQLQAVVNNQAVPVDSYTITNGQLQAVVNGQSMSLVNNQLLAFANGQLQPVVNNFDVSGPTNNTNTLVLIDQNDLTQQGGAIGGMFSVNMATGLSVGKHKLCAGAFVDQNFEVGYGVGELEILPRPLVITADDLTKTYGSENPPLTFKASGFSYDETLDDIVQPEITVNATTGSGAGSYPIVVSGGSATNYSLVLQNGTLTVAKKALAVIADNKSKGIGDENPPLTISYDGLVNGDDSEDVCVPVRPVLPKSIHQYERTATYTNVKLNGGNNKLIIAPGARVTLTADWSSSIDAGPLYCPGCITQNYIGIAGVFSTCHDVTPYQTYGSIDTVFIAPTTPGIYYITQIGSWQYYCHGNGEGYNFDNNNAADAIAVIVVQEGNESNTITASTIATANSSAGPYPITLTGCTSANYDVTYVNGTLYVGVLANTTRNNRSIVEQEAGQESYLAPNPASSVIRVKMNKDVPNAGNIAVVDVLGRVQSVKSIRQITNRMFELDVSALPKGVYAVKIKTVSGEKTFKFVKL